MHLLLGLEVVLLVMTLNLEVRRLTSAPNAGQLVLQDLWRKSSMGGESSEVVLSLHFSCSFA